MENFLTSSLLILIGLLSITLGYLIFRILLPVMGYVLGFAIAFNGIIAIYEENTLSYTGAIIIANIFGLAIAALAYYYYTAAVVLIAASISASLFSLLAQAVGLDSDGFIVALLALSGAVIGGLYVARAGIQKSSMVVLSSLFGVVTIFGATLLIFGELEMMDVYNNGLFEIIRSSFNSTWLWLLGILGATVLSSLIQQRVLANIIDKSRGRFLINNNQRSDEDAEQIN
jgi:hypothetical protein